MATSVTLLESSGRISSTPPESDAELEAYHSKAERGARRASIFTVYAKIFRLLLSTWIPTPDDVEARRRDEELEELVLPSNEEWRHYVYYQLVDLQREIDAEIRENEMEVEPEEEAKEQVKEVWEWEPGERVYPLRPKGGRRKESISSLEAISGIGGSMTEACIEPGWRVEDILLAAEVLQRRSQPLPAFTDEAEMRRVFGLVYDVLRYKQILDRALNDVTFWLRHPECRTRERVVWLLLYDMQGRKFSRRGEVNDVEARERAFRAAGLKDIEDALLETKTRLAASISRLRIGGSALTLGELLPVHLRSAEGVVWSEDGAVASGWVNTLKIPTKKDFVREMNVLGLRLCEDCASDEIDEDTFVFDPLCPKVVNLHDDAREKLAKSDLVRSHRFVFLERSLCLGASALARAVRSGRLCGPVVLTHSVTPRHTAYLAGLLADIEGAGRLLAFGTGEQRCEYEAYLHCLGVTLQQCRVYSERYSSAPPSAELERATIVLATPPCSYTGIRDAVDLAIARGGDVALLESLTNFDVEPKQSRSLLADQMATLKHALTRPNVQLLIYETHSILPAETVEMVDQVLQYANRIAVEKYIREHPQPKKKPSTKEAGTKSARSGRSVKHQESQQKVHQEERRSNYDDEDEALNVDSSEIKVPDSDLFELGSISDIYGGSSERLLDKGCYLAVIKRKEMMQFDSLFMIKVAEMKGLFGDLSKQTEPKEEQVVSPVRQNSQTSRKNFKRAKIQMNRIAAPTHSSMLRTLKQSQICPRHDHHVVQDEQTMIAQADASVPLPSTAPFSRFLIPSDESSQLLRSSSDSQDLQNRSGRLKSQQEQEESVRRLSTPTHASLGRTVNRKDVRTDFPMDDAEQLRPYREMIPVENKGRQLADEATLTKSISSLRKISLPMFVSNAPFRFSTEVHSSKRSSQDDIFHGEGVPGTSGRGSIATSSTTLSSAPRLLKISRATHRTLLESIAEDPEREDIAYVPPQKTSRLHHPGGPVWFDRMSLDAVTESVHGFRYPPPGTANTVPETGAMNAFA